MSQRPIRIAVARRPAAHRLFAPVFAALAAAAAAQTGVEPPPAGPGAAAAAGAASAPEAGSTAAQPRSPRDTPAPSPSPPVPPAPPASGTTQRIEIVGGRTGDIDERRSSTAAKIVFGREEIDRYGDATLGEVLRRLPGVDAAGGPGRGGPPRLRGLGGGFTQILIDGERIGPGFPIESLSPELVERIEILRAPTAETGARAIAGTINIVTREGRPRRINDPSLALTVESGTASPRLNWTFNERDGAWTTNLNSSLFVNRSETRASADTRVDEIDGDGVRPTSDRSESTVGSERRGGFNLGSRIEWRGGDGVSRLTLTPSAVFADRRGDAETTQVERVAPMPGAAPPFDLARSTSASQFGSLRLGTRWQQPIGGSRLELGASVNGWRSQSSARREEFAGGMLLDEPFVEQRRNRERAAALRGKLSSLLGGEAEPGREHGVVAGVELETTRRDEQRQFSGRGVASDDEGADLLEARRLRLAAYLQDDWSPSPNWSLQAGLRWEGLETQGDPGDGTSAINRSSVWSPLVHLLWRPEPKSRDQVRLSLTRSYRSPALGELIAAPLVNSRFPADQGTNEPLAPDRVGNPALRPELASGIDLAVEHYPAGGGVLGANLFARRIDDVIRTETTLQTVPWSAFERWVAQPLNIGRATTLGLELDARGRLSDWVADAPRLDLRASLSLYRSSVDGVPGPDNRLDRQAPAIANLGLDQRLTAWPLLVGGSLSWVPGYRTRLSATEAVRTPTRTVVDAYALWTIDATMALRLTLGNLLPSDGTSERDVVAPAVDGTVTAESVRATSESSTSVQLRLEMKL